MNNTFKQNKGVGSFKALWKKMKSEEEITNTDDDDDDLEEKKRRCQCVEVKSKSIVLLFPCSQYSHFFCCV